MCAPQFHYLFCMHAQNRPRTALKHQGLLWGSETSGGMNFFPFLLASATIQPSYEPASSYVRKRAYCLVAWVCSRLKKGKGEGAKQLNFQLVESVGGEEREANCSRRSLRSLFFGEYEHTLTWKTFWTETCLTRKGGEEGAKGSFGFKVGLSS